MNPAAYYSREVELALLNYIMLLPSCRERTFEQVEPEDFADQTCRECFEHMAKAWKQRQSLDAPAVQKWYIERFPDVLQVANASPWATTLSDFLEQSNRRSLLLQLQAAIEEGQDPTKATREILADITKTVAEIDRRAPSLGFIEPKKAVQMTIEATQKYNESSRMLTWGIGCVDGMNLLKAGNMVVVASRPGHGKTALFCTAANAQIDAGHTPFAWNCEMPIDQLINRIVSQRSGIPAHRIARAEFRGDEGQRYAAELERLAAMRFDFRAGNRWSINQLCSAVKESVRQRGAEIVYVDYLQALTVDSRRADMRTRVQEISGRLKELALEVEVPVVVMAQLNRMAEDVSPSVSHLAECSVIEQDADAILLLDRPHTRPEPQKRSYVYFNGETKERRQLTMEDMEYHAALILGKNRHGPTGVAFLHFDGAHMRFNPSRFRFNDSVDRQNMP